MRCAIKFDSSLLLLFDMKCRIIEKIKTSLTKSDQANNNRLCIIMLNRNLRYVNLVNSKINKICDVKVSEDRIKYQAEVQILPELADVVAADAPAFGHREHYDGYEQQNHGVCDEIVVSKLDIL